MTSIFTVVSSFSRVAGHTVDTSLPDWAVEAESIEAAAAIALDRFAHHEVDHVEECVPAEYTVGVEVCDQATVDAADARNEVAVGAVFTRTSICTPTLYQPR